MLTPEEIDAHAQVIAADDWRMWPHTFAEECSKHSPSFRFIAWPYLAYISERIAEAVWNGNGRLVINLPPGHGKSELLSHWLPTWFLDNWPKEKVISASHGAEMATHWGRIVRNEFERNPQLITRLDPDSTAADRWNTPEGGGMVTVGVGGGITGWRGNLILVDDPHPTWEAAQSYTHRERVKEWFDGTLYDRREPGATVIVLMHRWHDDDLSGHLIDDHGDQWTVIKFPAIADAVDVLGRQPGEPLNPARFGLDELNQTKSIVGTTVFDAKYQQNPSGLGKGRVYERFSEANQDKELALRNDLALDVSFDFNRNPGMHVEIGQYDGHRDLATCVHEIHGPYMKLGPALYALGKLIESYGPTFKWPLMRIFGDATGTQDRAETTATAYQMIANWVAQKPWKTRYYVPAKNPPVIDRIDTFNAVLRDDAGEVHYKVNPKNCPRLIEDFKTLKADEQGMIDKRKEKLSHASDAEGYRMIQLRPIRRAVKRGRNRVGATGQQTSM